MGACASVWMRRPVCAHACLWEFMSMAGSVCRHVCVCCDVAATLHGDSILRQWRSAAPSLAVTSHHLPVSETAEQRAAYEQ